MSSDTHRPFGDNAKYLASLGLAVIPCPGASGKSPGGAVRGFGKWRQAMGIKALERLIERWPSANIGVITSLSGVTVVDVDGDDSLREDVVHRIGKTPLITRTPSGGTHLWYKSNGEPNANLRSYGYQVDVKGVGAGIVIVPPSYSRTNGNPYLFALGSWDDLSQLPTANIAALLNRFSALQDIGIGNRNEALFRFALQEAGHCDDAMALRDVLFTKNEELQVPLQAQEVERIALSAWRYEKNGQNWVRRCSHAKISARAFDSMMSFKNGSDAIALYVKLQHAHGARTSRNEDFAISPNSMAANRVISMWSPTRIRKARDVLLACNLIKRVSSGGRKPNDPHRYRLKR